MQEMIESVRATVQLAVRQGSTQARIALAPPELGGIRIHLSQTADGLLARIVPESQAAAQALSEGRTELHRSLSSLGVPLRLDVGSLAHHSDPDQSPPGQGGAGGRAGSGATGSAFRSRRLGRALDAQDAGDPPVAVPLLTDPRLPASLLVFGRIDVLA